LVIDAVAPNLPFTLMQRSGYAVMNPSKDNIVKALGWDYDFVVLQDEYFMNEFRYNFPEISGLKKIAGNGKISVFKPNPKSGDLLRNDSFTNNPAYIQSINFEGTIDDSWTNTRSTDSISHSGDQAGHMKPEDEFGLTFKSSDLRVLKRKETALMFSSKFLRTQSINTVLVIKINSNEKHIYYREFNLQDVLKAENEWQTVSLMFRLPKIETDNFEFSVYFWDPGKGELFYDDIKMEVY
jgi:hypothetical protein